MTPDAIATEPRLTRDGRLLACLSDESGGWEVYVESYRTPGERVRVSVDGGSQPRWRADGEELFYRKPSGPVMAVAVREVDARIEAGLPVELFDAGEWGTRAGDHDAVSADGQRFLVKVPLRERELRMHVVVGWKSLLEPEE